MHRITQSFRVLLGFILLLPVMGQFTAADNFDLQAVTDVAIHSKNAQELERKLNKAGNKYNNLDLDMNGVLDFIHVTEINNHAGRGFSLSVEVTQGEVQELAFIQFEQVANSRSIYVETIGNSQIYGQNYFCQCSLISSNVTIWPYLIRDHVSYQSAYSFNNYPNYFLRRKPKNTQAYKNFHISQPYSQTIHPRGTSSLRSIVRSPNFGRTARTIKAPLFNPNQQRTPQRQFYTTQPLQTRTRTTFHPYSPTVIETPFSQRQNTERKTQQRSVRAPIIGPSSHPNSTSNR